MGMTLADSKIPAALMLLISLTINLAFLYGIATRPVISYHLSTPLDYNSTIDFDLEKLRVEFNIMNKGLSPARVWLVVRTYNLSLPGTEGFSVEEADGVSVLRVPWDAPAHQSEYETFELTIDSASNATHLVLLFSIEGNWKARPNVRFYNSFAIYKPERPTALLLKHISYKKFLRATSR